MERDVPPNGSCIERLVVVTQASLICAVVNMMAVGMKHNMRMGSH